MPLYSMEKTAYLYINNGLENFGFLILMKEWRE